jgi:hypothetical protein
MIFIAGVLWLRQSVDETYDEKFSNCMEVKKSWVPAVVAQNFQNEQYQQMMNDCEREANS